MQYNSGSLDREIRFFDLYRYGEVLTGWIYILMDLGF